MPSNTISYVIPANTRINKDSGDGAPNSVDITGGFSVTYTYNNAGVLTGQAVSAVSIRYSTRNLFPATANSVGR